ATANSELWRSTSATSSLLPRTCPWSVACPMSSFTPPSSFRLERRLPDAHSVAALQFHRDVDALLVDERAVGRAGVLDPERPVTAGDARGPLRHECVGGQPNGAPAAAPDRELAVDRILVTLLGVGLQHDEPPPALRARARRRWRRGCGGRGHGRAHRRAPQ